MIPQEMTKRGDEEEDALGQMKEIGARTCVCVKKRLKMHFSGSLK